MCKISGNALNHVAGNIWILSGFYWQAQHLVDCFLALFETAPRLRPFFEDLHFMQGKGVINHAVDAFFFEVILEAIPVTVEDAYSELVVNMRILNYGR